MLSPNRKKSSLVKVKGGMNMVQPEHLILSILRFVHSCANCSHLRHEMISAIEEATKHCSKGCSI